MKVKIQKNTVLFPTLDLSDRKLLGKKMKAMILALSILSKIYIKIPLNREKIFKSDDDSKWKYTQTNNKKGRLLGKTSIFYSENIVLALPSNLSVSKLDF